MQQLKEVRFTGINMDYFPKDIDKLKKKNIKMHLMWGSWKA